METGHPGASDEGQSSDPASYHRPTIMLRLGCLVLLAFLAPTNAQDGAAPSVTLSGTGTVVGVTNTTTGLDEFLGNPYAQPPVGSLRFAAPLPLSNDAARLIRATQYGHVCPQQPSVNVSSTTKHHPAF